MCAVATEVRRAGCRTIARPALADDRLSRSGKGQAVSRRPSWRPSDVSMGEVGWPQVAEQGIDVERAAGWGGADEPLNLPLVRGRGDRFAGGLAVPPGRSSGQTGGLAGD